MLPTTAAAWVAALNWTETVVYANGVYVSLASKKTWATGWSGKRCSFNLEDFSFFSSAFSKAHLVLPSKLVPDWALTHSASWLVWRHMNSNSSSSIHSSICYYSCCYNSFVHGDGQMRVTSATEVRVKDWLSCTWKSLSLSLSSSRLPTVSQTDRERKKKSKRWGKPICAGGLSAARLLVAVSA